MSETKPTILHVVPSFGFGGLENVICSLIKHGNLGWHSILALDGNQSAARWLDDFPVRFIEFEKPASRRQFFGRLSRTLQRLKPDLLMTYNWGATDAVWLGRLVGMQRIIHSEHGFNADEAAATDWRRDIVRWGVYRMASKVVVVSHDLAELLERRYRLGSDRVALILNGVDTALFAPPDGTAQQIRSTLGFGADQRLVGFVGRLDAIKRVDFLGEVFAKLHEKVPDCGLLIVGDGPERNRLESVLRAQGVDPYVTVVGYQHDVLPYLWALDALLLTSVREQMPMSVLEAMSAGVPVVATAVGELPFMIDEGTTGFLHSLSDPPEHFADSLREVLSPAHAKSMKKAARAKIVREFQHKRMIAQYQDLVQSLF